MDQAKIVIRDIHRYGDDLTVAEAIARLRGGGPVTVTVTDPAPPGGDPRGDPRHGFGITISPAGGTSPRGQPEIAWDGTASCDPAGTALFAEALALAGQLASRTAAPADAAKERTRPPVNENLRQVIHDHMAQIAARHAAALYPHTDGDTAAQLFALLADTALAYQMEVEAELADLGPGQSLAAASGLSAKETLLTGLGENLDLKDDNPGTAPRQRVARLARRERRGGPPVMTSPAHWQRGDRVALVATDDPDTRLRPGDEGTVIRWDPAQEQLHVRWNSGSTLSMLPGEGDQVRLLARAAGEDGTEPEDPGEPDDGEPAPD